MTGPSRQPWHRVEQELVGLLSRVDPNQFETLAASFRKPARRWFFSGQGRSGLVAQMAAMRFMHLGLEAHVVGEATAPAVDRGDSFLLICGSGRTPVSTGFAAIAKAAGATLIVLTHKPDTALARSADVLLTIPMGDSVQFGGTLFEQGCLVLLDAVALNLASGSMDHAAMWKRHTNMQ